jgi:enoyl-CoA hydratase/carnithine racemase
MTGELTSTLDDGVRILTLRRPHVKNALDRTTVTALTAALRDVERDPQSKSVLITGDGGAFSSGADLKAAMTEVSQGPAASVELFHDLARALHGCPRPVVALVDGPAAGFGVSLALGADLRVATDRAYFQLSFARIGLVTDGGASWFLPRLVGVARAAELMFLGERLDAASALEMGLVNRVVPVEEGPETALGLARRLAKGPPRALRLMRRLVYDNLQGDLSTALDRERDAQVQCLTSPDLLEGVSALFQKRDPKWEEE